MAAQAVDVGVTSKQVRVELADGRALAVPTAWYPRLVHATARERGHWRLIARGTGIHWPDLDEDISIEGLLAGRHSGELAQSLKRWLNSRTAARARRRVKKIKTLGGR